MSVIVELDIHSTDFQLGQILSTGGESKVSLKTMVPLGEQPVPFFYISEYATDSFEAHVRNQSSVSELYAVDTHNNETLYGLDWNINDDTFFDTLMTLDGHILAATGEKDQWMFQIQFRTHEAFSRFQESCFEGDIPINIKRIYNPTKPEAGPWYGLSPPQRKTLRYAVEMGYYSLPRGISTQEIANEFEISDQAVSERLRRAIKTLVSSTLLQTAPDK
jgi:predicted DNA binding protein